MNNITSLLEAMSGNIGSRQIILILIEEGIMLWDIAAAAAIAEAAGCATFCDRLEGYSRVYRCFANKRLMEDFNAKGV